MKVFVDTSAFYALLDRDDRYHEPAREQFDELSREGHQPLTHNYIIVETVAILQNRLGLEAVDDFTENLLRPVTTVWIEKGNHESAMNACLMAREESISFIDHVSFQFMRDHDLETVFGFDTDFIDRGFNLVPSDQLD